MNWTKCKDKLPPEYKKVLVYHTRIGIEVDYMLSGGFWCSDMTDDHSQVTYWQDLPLKPDEYLPNSSRLQNVTDSTSEII